MERDDVGGAEDAVESRGALHTELAEALLGHERVVTHDAHAETDRTARHLLSDATEADDTERLPVELDSAPSRTLPAPLFESSVRLRDVARERHEQADRLLRRRDHGRLGCIRHDDAMPCGCVDVDV